MRANHGPGAQRQPLRFEPRAVAERDAHAALARIPSGRLHAEAQLRAVLRGDVEVRSHAGLRK